MNDQFDTSCDPFFFDPRWPVLYEDNHLLAVYKPSGLLVQGDRTGDVCLQTLGKQWLKQRYHKPGDVFLAIVHRLDRPVAGVVLLARTSKAAARLAAQFRQRSVKKSYLAVVHGRVGQTEGRLIHHLERHHRHIRVVASPTDRSQEARLSYTVLDRQEDKSLLRVDLETGRRHQIRIQLARLGHPILGDLRYGAASALPGRALALLAHTLTVTHPTRQHPLVINCPIPQDWPWDAGSAAQMPPPWNWREFDLEALSEPSTVPPADDDA